MLIFKYLFKKGFRRFFCSINIEHFRMDFPPKNAEKFECKTCYYVCSKQSEWNRHVMTLKHKNRTFLNAGDANIFLNLIIYCYHTSNNILLTNLKTPQCNYIV